MLKIATKIVPEPASFQRAWSAGFRFVEFWLNAELLSDVDTIIKTAQQYPFQYVPHFPNKKNDEQSVQQAIKLYRELNCEAIVIHQPMIDTWKETFVAQEPEIRFAVENHRLSVEKFWEWAEKNPGLNLDVEHLWKFTLKNSSLDEVLAMLEQFLDRYSEKLYHVHLPGYVPGAEEHRPMYCNRDFVHGVWERLENVNYRGLVVSEINSEYQTDQDLKMDQLLFERWWMERNERS